MDQTTVDRLVRGESDAVRESRVLVTAWLMRNAGPPFTREDVEDMAGETIRRAWRAAAEYQGRSKPETWLVGIAKYVLRDERRFRRRHAPSAVSLEATKLEPAAQVDPEELATDLIAANLAMEQLTTDQREAVRLLLFEGLTSKEASRVMDKRDGAVRNLFYRAMMKIRATDKQLPR